MSEGHFWHDMIENVVIWEADDVTPAGAGPSHPIEAQQDDLTTPHHHDAAPAPDSGTSAEWIDAVHHDDDATA